MSFRPIDNWRHEIVTEPGQQPALAASQVNCLAITPAMQLLPGAMDTPEARVMLLAIGLQESRLTARRQLVGNPPRPTGPAAGLWQFERGGGVRGVLEHQASRYWMHRVCHERGVKPVAAEVWQAMQVDDILAAAAARLLLFTDPRRLPALGDEAAAWQCYIRTWRPGKPHRSTWPALYAVAMGEVALA
jgi:hypothetical protein